MSTATERTQTQRQFTSADKQRLRRRLLAWYADHARDLPWRRSRDPYRVWVSEVMLQQTTVAAVRPYFERFVAAFPDVYGLASADEGQVLRLWEGLGYYRRARQLHAAARIVVAEHSGRFPRDLAKLQELPGIGRYTAGAIASIAFDVRAPILEANTLRLLSRLIAYREDPLKAPGQRVLWQFAEEILPRREVARFNQALMELGSLVCTPVEPKCNECPLVELCGARVAGMQHTIPRAKVKQQFTALHEAAIVIRKHGRILMRQCGEGERWTGLWDFPRFALEADEPLLARDELAAKIRSSTGVDCHVGLLLTTLRHGVTRYRIRLDCFAADYISGRLKSVEQPVLRWLPIAKLSELPLSTTGRRIAGLAVSQQA
jgi:A/G-specific adenine glycosylase